MRAVIFVNGVVADPLGLERWLRPHDYLVGADGGTRHCLALGRIPHVVVGDMDSLDPNLVRSLQDDGVILEIHPPEKEKTDLDLAIERAIRDGAHQILLLGAMGGRLDQCLANWLLLARREWGVPISLAEGDQLAQAVQGGETLTIEGQVGSIVSAIPLSRRVTGITYRGLAYALEGASLCLGSTRGVSNVMLEATATITVGDGLLLVIQEVADGD